MTSRIESEVSLIRATLDKALGSDGAPEVFLDAITALKKVPISIDLLRKTKIGQTLQEVKKKFASDDVGASAKALLSKWKKDCEAASSSTDDANKKPTVAIPKPESPPSEAPAKSPRNLEEEELLSESHYASLSSVRRKVMDLFVDNFKLDIGEGVAKFLAFNVEASINAVHSADRDSKAYLNKSRSLAFNLKKNERLRRDIVEGRLQADHLVHLTTSELATDEVREERDHATKQADLARRGDLYEITRAAILTANGIDPNKGGEFCCRRCKGTKTTHYSLQTRSSDEPMTVFVCCLTCGNRWRCT